MFQSQEHIKAPEEQFTEMYEEFLKVIKGYHNSIDLRFNMNEIFKGNNSEYDMSKVYTIKEGLYWNNPENEGKQCMIGQKNDKIAVVLIKGNPIKKGEQNLFQYIYRLEDLESSDDIGKAFKVSDINLN